jgi:pimeloyl-ACP methyl ester carboxylesterase
VFLLHGTPGSRLGPFPRARVLYELGVRLITFDRPGYGRSDRHARRRVADAAADVATIADALGLDRFAVLGRSGGGPHALACAALLPGRVTRAAVLVGLAPLAARGLDWFAGMADSNVGEYTTATAGPELLVASLGLAARGIRADPASLVAMISGDMPESDQRIVADAGIRAMLVRNYAEAVRTSADGWYDDILAFVSLWGFEPAEIDVPVLLWHGENDRFSPVSHSLWLGQEIPDSVLMVEPGSAHFGALSVMPDVLAWLIRKTAESQVG